MSSLSVTVGANGGQESRVFASGSLIRLRKGFLAVDLLRSSFKGSNRIWLKGREWPTGRSVHKVHVFAKIRKGKKHDYPWPEDIDPNIESGHLSYLSHFKPLQEKPKPVTLAFEKPLVDLEKKIVDVRKMADETGLDFSDQISALESKYQQALKDLYTHLTPIQRLNIARHPNRPTFLDHVLNITEKWVELHGDRAGYDDPAIVTGIGTMDGKNCMFLGHQKGRNTKENIERNFGMPTPHGYRKAKRMMEYADHHGLPIITFIDTPGAYADLKSEELGQGEAIANNLRTMFGLKVPIVSVVIGEGGSGGALAIGCANKLLMMENSVFYVASPEACAAILWKSSQAAPKAAEKLKITAKELLKLKIADGIIPEPLGGAHTDPSWASQQIKLAVSRAMDELSDMDTEKLLQHRNRKFRIIGGFQEGIPVDPEKKSRMKPMDVAANSSISPVSIEAEIESLKKKIQEAKGPSLDPLISDKAIEKLRQEVDQEITNAFISMGLQEKRESLKLELSKTSASLPNQPLNPGLKEKVDKLMQDFKNKLSQPGAFLGLKQKLECLKSVDRLIEQKSECEKLKKEINDKLEKEVKQKMEILKRARERVANGEQLDEDQKAEFEQLKAEFMKALEASNLKVVGVGKKKGSTLPPDLVEKISKIDGEIQREIGQAVNSAGVRVKIEELKGEIGRGSSRERVIQLKEEIKEGIMAAVKEKVEDVLTSEGLVPLEAVGADGNLGTDSDSGRD